MPKPVRIQLSRKKGFRLQEVSKAINGLPAVKVDRSTRWGNPLTKELMEARGRCGSNSFLVEAFSEMMIDEFKQRARRELRGLNLACWCPLDQPCHADVLLVVAMHDLTHKRILEVE